MAKKMFTLEVFPCLNILLSELLEIPQETPQSSKEGLAPSPKPATLRIKEEGESHTQTVNLMRHHLKF